MRYNFFIELIFCWVRIAQASIESSYRCIGGPHWSDRSCEFQNIYFDTADSRFKLFLLNNIDAEDVSVGIVGRGHYDTTSKCSPDILRID
jgi:hypothetical protein